MPKLINKIVASIEVEYFTSYDMLSIYSSFDDIKNIMVIQDLGNMVKTERLDVNTFGIRGSFFNNAVIEINGDEF